MCDLFGGGGSNKVKTTVEIPKFLEEAAKRNIATAEQIASREFPRYEAPRIADFTADQRRAFEAVRDNMGVYRPVLDQATSTVGQIATTDITDADIGARINPFVEQALSRAADEIARRGGITRAQLERQMAASGGFGGARHGVVEAEQLRNQERAIADLFATGLAQAYDRAVNQFNLDRQMQLEAARDLAQLGGLRSELGLRDAAALLDIGGAQQALEQANLDVAFEDFLREINFPVEMLNVRLAATQGAPHGQTTVGPGPNRFAENLGAFGALAGGIGLLAPLFM